MLTQEQIHETFSFSENMGRFINRDGVRLFMGQSQDDNTISNSFYIYGDDDNKHYLGQISFEVGSCDYNYFIDNEVIHYLKEIKWI